MALTYTNRRNHNDGQPRTSIPVWVHLTKEEFEAVQRSAESAGFADRGRRFLHDLAEEAIRQKIGAHEIRINTLIAHYPNPNKGSKPPAQGERFFFRVSQQEDRHVSKNCVGRPGHGTGVVGRRRRRRGRQERRKQGTRTLHPLRQGVRRLHACLRVVRSSLRPPCCRGQERTLAGCRQLR
jgi:hypothetical protein